MSMASGRFEFPPQDRTTRYPERDSLSQNPLAQATILSEEGGSSCCSLSQHSLSPRNQEKHEDMDHPAKTVTADHRQGILSRESREESETPRRGLCHPQYK